MSIFVQVLTLVGEPPGSYVYHLVLLFALEAAAAIALSQWWAKRDSARARLSLAAGGIFLLRLLPLIAALLAAAGVLDPLVALPPLDRAASTLTLLLIVWTFAFPDSQRVADAALVGLTLLALIALGISWPLWAQEVASGATFYNGSVYDTGWEIALIALMTGGVLLLGVRRKSDWPLGLGLLLLMIAGHGLHLFRPVQFSNIPNAARLAELVALPIFTAMVYRRAHAGEAARRTEPHQAAVPAQTASPDLPAEPAARSKLGLDPKAAAALASLNAATPDEMAQMLPLALAHTFRADLCLLITPPDASGLANIAGAYDLIREKFLPGASLPLSEVPDLAPALYRGQVVQLAPDRQRSQIRYLVNAVGVDHTGPALVTPFLSEEGPLLAAAVLISAYSQREWSPEDEQLMAALTEPIADAFALVERMARLSQEAEQHQAQLESVRQEEQAARDEAQRLTAELNAARAEAERLTLESDRAQVEMDHQREEAEALTQELKAQHEAEMRQSTLTDEISVLRANLQQAQREAEARDRIEAELNAALERVDALAELEAKLESVTREAEAHKQRTLELAAELEQARVEAATATQVEEATASAAEAAATAPISTFTPTVDVERLQAELALARREAQDRQQLQEELQETLESFKLQSALAADLQMDISGYKQIESQLRKELDLTRAELKKFTDAREAPAEADVDHEAVAKLQAALADTLAELSEKSRTLDEALEQLQRQERQLAKMQAALTAMAGQTQPLEEMKAQLAEKERQLAEAQAALIKQVNALTPAQKQLAEKEQQLADAQFLIAELYEQANALTTLREQFADKERRLAKAQSALSALSGQTQSLEKLQRELAEAQTQLAEKERGLVEAQATSTLTADQAEQLTQLQTQLAQAQADRAEKERQLAEAQAALAPLAEQLAQLQHELNEAQVTLSAQADALNKAREQLAEKERRLAGAQARVVAEAPPRFTAPFSAPSYEVILSLVQELRQPMSSIVGYSDLLMGESVGILGALQQKFLERIIASCERMEALLDDLIRVTALDSGKLKLAHDSLDVMSVIEEAILGCSAQFREKSINLRMDLSDNLPAVLADRDALRQIVSHLLNNAASASAMDGEVTLNVQAEAPAHAPGGASSADGLFISVRDSGGGIAPEDQPRVFSRTYRADAPLIAGLGETAGMGLFIAKALTEAQGGRIWVTSELGQGSTFSVFLPVTGQPITAGGNGSNPPGQSSD